MGASEKSLNSMCIPMEMLKEALTRNNTNFLKDLDFNILTQQYIQFLLRSRGALTKFLEKQ